MSNLHPANHPKPPPGQEDISYETLCTMLWLLLHRHGGEIVFTREDLDRCPPKGELFLQDGAAQMVLRAVVK